MQNRTFCNSDFAYKVKSTLYAERLRESLGLINNAKSKSGGVVIGGDGLSTADALGGGSKAMLMREELVGLLSRFTHASID